MGYNEENLRFYAGNKASKKPAANKKNLKADAA
jgi:hypothetical protein